MIHSNLQGELPISLPSPAFYGRHGLMLSEMFALSIDQLLGKKILDIPGGPSTLNALVTRIAHQTGSSNTSIISCDPVYSLPVLEIWKKAISDINRITDLYFQNPQSLNPLYFNINGDLLTRLSAVMDKERHLGFLCEFMDDFLKDVQDGTRRYRALSLPDLSEFDTNAFDLALIGHLLFVYGNETDLNFDFHLDSLEELTRVAIEVRVFPVGGLNGKISPLLNEIRESLLSKGIFSDVHLSPNDMVAGEGWDTMLILSRDQERVTMPCPMLLSQQALYPSGQNNPWKINYQDLPSLTEADVIAEEERWKRISSVTLKVD